MLVALFALIGLLTDVAEWETSFKYRSDSGEFNVQTTFFTDMIVFIVSLLGAVAIITKFYFESVW